MSAKVLLVDDSRDTLDLVLMGVEAYSPTFVVKVAITASEGVEMMNSEAFDVVILDIALPDITGTALAELIREKNPNIPIAFLSNYNGPTAVNSACVLNAEFWFKPDVLDNFDKLIDCINKLIRGESCKAEIKEIEIPKLGE